MSSNCTCESFHSNFHAAEVVPYFACLFSVENAYVGYLPNRLGVLPSISQAFKLIRDWALVVVAIFCSVNPRNLSLLAFSLARLLRIIIDYIFDAVALRQSKGVNLESNRKDEFDSVAASANHTGNLSVGFGFFVHLDFVGYNQGVVVLQPPGRSGVG